MNMEKAIQCALDGQAILFAGSGFSFGATNISKNTFRTGESLRNLLAEKCGIIKTSGSLENAALLYKKKHSVEELIKIIKEEFTLGSIEPYHEIVLSLPWKRIYTTNYDRVIEEAASKNGRSLTPITMSDNLDDYTKKDICVHINGYIERLNSDTINNEFKLIDRSYSSDTLNGQPWFEFMKSDFKSAKAIIIVGFSMQFDIDIKRLISPPDISKKVVFITKPDLDEMDAALLEDYGECEQIGIAGLSKIIQNESRRFLPSIAAQSFTSFIYEHMSTFRPSTVSYEDMVDMFFYGDIKEKLVFKNYIGEYKYLLYRSAIFAVIDNLTQKKIFLVTSDLGNGKTVFCDLIRNELREKDVHVFYFRKRLIDMDTEIERITAFTDKPCIVIIDNYQSHFDIIERFKEYGIKNITLILTSRSSINHLSYRKLCNKLKVEQEEIKPIFLDYLKNEEIDNLALLLKEHSLLSQKLKSQELCDIKEYLTYECNCKFSNILLDLFRSSDIKNRLKALYEDSINENLAVRELSVFALMKATMNIEVDFTEMTDLLDIDFIALSKNESVYLNEIFSFENDDINIKSSITAKELLYSIVDFNFLIEIMTKIVIAADNAHKANKDYEELLKNLVSHSHFLPFISNAKDSKFIVKYYDNIRNTAFCKNNPFFWEQFASSCIDAKNYSLANQCLENAFISASQIPYFVPFQIETIKGRCIMEEILYKLNISLLDNEIVIQKIIECHMHLVKHYIHPDNNVHFVFKVGVKYKEIFDLYKNRFDNRQQSIFLENTVDMIKRMEKYLQENPSAYNASTVKNWVEELKLCNFKTKQTK